MMRPLTLRRSSSCDPQNLQKDLAHPDPIVFLPGLFPSLFGKLPVERPVLFIVVNKGYDNLLVPAMPKTEMQAKWASAPGAKPCCLFVPLGKRVED